MSRLILQWWADYLDINRKKGISPFEFGRNKWDMLSEPAGNINKIMCLLLPTHIAINGWLLGSND